MSLWRTTETLLGVSFETCLRCRRDALMGCRCYVLLRRCHDFPIRCCGDIPVRRVGDVPPKRCWVFYLRRTCDVDGTYRETSLQRRYDVLLPSGFVRKRRQPWCKPHTVWKWWQQGWHQKLQSPKSTFRYKWESPNAHPFLNFWTSEEEMIFQMILLQSKNSLILTKINVMFAQKPDCIIWRASIS